MDHMVERQTSTDGYDVVCNHVQSTSSDGEERSWAVKLTGWMDDVWCLTLELASQPKERRRSAMSS